MSFNIPTNETIICFFSELNVKGRLAIYLSCLLNVPIFYIIQSSLRHTVVCVCVCSDDYFFRVFWSVRNCSVSVTKQNDKNDKNTQKLHLPLDGFEGKNAYAAISQISYMNCHHNIHAMCAMNGNGNFGLRQIGNGRGVGDRIWETLH